MSVLYRPGLCEKCDRCRQNEKFCVREKFHAIRKRFEIINGVATYGPYQTTCKAFSERNVEVE